MADRLKRQSSTASRRTLERRPSNASSRRDVFSDDHAVDDLITVADGFRPAPTGAQPSPRTSLRRPQPPPPRPSEESKPEKRRSLFQSGIALAQRNSFSLRHDNADGPQRMASVRTEMSQRPSSMISTFSLPRAQSPYMGASGPSHPYAMYPQDTSLNRSSTMSSGDAGPSRPTHPYGMYPQTTLAESDPLAASTDITTIGFPGLGRSYARRLGPDGEDADDIIGPDGHTEQLPPYSRYPDGHPPPKERYAPVPVPATATSSLSSTTMVEDTVNEPASSPRERLIPRQDENGDPIPDEDTEPTPRWARKGRRRFFLYDRVPGWCLGIAILVLVAVAAGLGVVAGRHWHQNSPPEHKSGSAAIPDLVPTSYPTTVIAFTTTLIDAIPVTPAANSLPKLPQGNFGFGLHSPTDSSSGCLQDPRQAAAGPWACTDDADMTFSVEGFDTSPTRVYLAGANGRALQYGPQAPIMPGPIEVQIMKDRELMNMGPAFFFQSAYTKQVILPGPALSMPPPPGRAMKRLAEALDPHSKLFARDQHVQPGDQPWYCFWNNTLVEGFIFVQPNGSSSTSAAPTTAIPSLSPPSLSPSAPATPPSGASSTAAFTPLPSSHLRPRGPGDAWGRHHHHADSVADALSPYPFPMKIEERRTPANLIKPICQQMTIDNQLQATPLMVNGQPQIITVEEDDPLYQQRLARRGGDPQACVCQWMTGP